MASIEVRHSRDGRPRYRVQIRRRGYPITSKTFSSKRAAAEYAARTEEAMLAGSWTRDATRHTVAILIDRYIVTICPTKKTGNRQVQQLTAWRQLIGNYEAKLIRPAHIAEARDQIAIGRGPATVVRYLSALSHMFTIAVKDWQLLDRNPVAFVTWPRESRGRVRFLSDEEREQLLAACKQSSSSNLYPIVMLALLTGMRRGEILSLTWKDIDFQRSRLILQQTKNGERRKVTLVPLAVQILEQWKAIHRAIPHPTRPVFRFSRYRWQEAVTRAGLTDFRFHDLRHTAASYLAMTGASTREIAELLGHKTLSMVQRYSHLTMEHNREVLERMSDEIFGKVQVVD